MPILGRLRDRPGEHLSGGEAQLVAIARARIFNVMRVGTLLHVVLVGYATLIVYEWWLLRAIL